MEFLNAAQIVVMPSSIAVTGRPNNETRRDNRDEKGEHQAKHT
jgi:hypothetical protein